jgi:hypothetical protein
MPPTVPKASHPSALAYWRIRTAIRRQLAADVRLLREMEYAVADLERHIDAERRGLAALRQLYVWTSEQTELARSRDGFGARVHTEILVP